LPEKPVHHKVTCSELEGWINDGANCVILDFALHTEYSKAHIPGAHFVIRSRLEQLFETLPTVACYVITCPDGELSPYIAAELEALLDAQIKVLAGGTAVWIESGRNIESGDSHLLSPPIDRYRRPYEGTQVSKEVMQAYLDWEFGLVEQLKRDGTHHFECINSV
jgi:rhodanese-related sulfurtransferase